MNGRASDPGRGTGEPSASVRFFDSQFRAQLDSGDLRLNPFEQAALPWLHGEVLDYGCGLGNLAVAAAEQDFEAPHGLRKRFSTVIARRSGMTLGGRTRGRQ